MSGRVHRMMQAQAAKVSQHHAKILAPAVKAALDNEEKTRGRVKTLEDHARDVDSMFQRPLLGRFKWLILGR